MTKIDSISHIPPIDGARMRQAAADTPRSSAPAQATAGPSGVAARAASAGTGEWLMNARAALESVPRVDAVKVTRLKAMLANGELAFDSERVADCILDRHGISR
ncbi:flagellar biosynthesis anti-sigma factor FlgM [Pandoraea pulmonicola]|uniref:Negative regulator of flagellin synthesis n=1 Tax=Pandoraea pulmonicola TaxID=93221 RepID=A0AAJ5CZP1_PANPU|nr:flagellar biosynthesis anti-sigma factor FlgM [Pandoraea pulmonicola]AJC21367.1 flagellar biosynthesis anti-sigma factor FlgM [Pandoraea pulmonicola]SUA89901.1 flagellar biosynthesis anti-sigma factor FlgM [Pandoraea pulmonicola]